MAGPARAADARLTDERAAAERLLRRLAAVGVALMLVVIVSSAYLRLAQAGLSCSDWPACYGRIATRPELAPEMHVARLAHRIAAGTVGVVLIALLLIAATQRPRLKPQTAVAAGALLVALGLAGLGAQSSAAAPGAPLPAVTLANLGGGFALLALLWWLSLPPPPRPPPAGSRTGLRWIAALTLAAATVQILLGGLVSAKFAALSCPSLPICGAPWPDGALLSSLDPTQPLAVGGDGAIVRPPALAALPWVHRIGALVLVVFGALLVSKLLQAGRAPRRQSLILAGLLLLQVALGIAATLLEAPLAVVLGHNLVAALLVCALVSANRFAHAAAST
jgi:cytochrome c oxidase assembly protein subunit 15